MSFFFFFALHSADDKTHAVHQCWREREGIKRSSTCAWISVFNRTRSLTLFLQSSLIQERWRKKQTPTRADRKTDDSLPWIPMFRRSDRPVVIQNNDLTPLPIGKTTSHRQTERERDRDIPLSPSNTYKRWPFLFDFCQTHADVEVRSYVTQTLESKPTLCGLAHRIYDERFIGAC